MRSILDHIVASIVLWKLVVLVFPPQLVKFETLLLIGSFKDHILAFSATHCVIHQRTVGVEQFLNLRVWRKALIVFCWLAKLWGVVRRAASISPRIERIKAPITHLVIRRLSHTIVAWLEGTMGSLTYRNACYYGHKLFQNRFHFWI